MLPETIFRLIEPHIEGYTDKQRAELIKFIQKDRKDKPRAMTEKQKEKIRMREAIENHFKRAQERNRKKREG